MCQSTEMYQHYAVIQYKNDIKKIIFYQQISVNDRKSTSYKTFSVLSGWL